MFKNLLTGLLLIGAVEIAAATYQDGQTTERPQVILRYNTAGGVEGVETRTLTDKIIYRSQVEGGSDESLYGPALQYKNIFFQLPNRGEKFDFSKNDWRYPVGSVEGTIVNLLVGAQDDWERRRQELLSLKDLGEGGEEAGIIQERINGTLAQDSSDYKVFFNSRKDHYVAPFYYRYGDVLSGDVSGYYNSSPFFFLSTIFGGDFRRAPAARAFQVLDTYLRDLSSVSKASVHRTLVGQPDRRSGLMSGENDVLVLTDTPDSGSNYTLGGRFDTPTVFPNGYVSAGLGSASRRAPVQVILDTLNFTLKTKFQGLSEDQKGQAFYDMIQKFSKANQVVILSNPDTYSGYLKRFYGVLPKVLGDIPMVGQIQRYLVTRARAANLVAEPGAPNLELENLIYVFPFTSDSDINQANQGIFYQFETMGDVSRTPAKTRSLVTEIQYSIGIPNAIDPNFQLIKGLTVGLYNNLINYDNPLLIKKLGFLEHVGIGGKVKVYVSPEEWPSEVRRSYPGIPVDSTLMYTIILTDLRSYNGVYPKQYSFLEEYPMCLKPSVDQGLCDSCWAHAASTSVTYRLGKGLVDRGLAPPNYRKPILKNNKIIGYEPLPETKELADKMNQGRLSAQMLITSSSGNIGCKAKEPLLAHFRLAEEYILTKKYAPDLCPKIASQWLDYGFLFNGNILEEDYGNKIGVGPIPYEPGGFTKKISGDFPFMVTGVSEMKQALLTGGPITATIQMSEGLINHTKGIYSFKEGDGFVGSSDNPRLPEDGWHVVSVIGWGTSENGEGYWIIENSWGDIYELDSEGSFTKEYYSKGHVRIGGMGKDPLIIESNAAYAQTPLVLRENGKIETLDPLKDLYQGGLEDGYLPWPYERP